MFSKPVFQNDFKPSLKKESKQEPTIVSILNTKKTAITKRISSSEVNLKDTLGADSVCANPLTLSAIREKTTEEVLDMLMRDPICEASDSFWELTLDNQKSITSYLSEEVEHSNKQWSGCGGCIGYFCIFSRIFCVCCPIVCCVQRCIREKNREMTK